MAAAVIQPTVAPSAASGEEASVYMATEMIPPYQDDIDIIDPEGGNRPQWPF
jgi:hypothetical protein